MVANTKLEIAVLGACGGEGELCKGWEANGRVPLKNFIKKYSNPFFIVPGAYSDLPMLVITAAVVPGAPCSEY
jgi:hypothetical protein